MNICKIKYLRWSPGIDSAILRNTQHHIYIYICIYTYIYISVCNPWSMKTPHTQASFFPDFKPSRYKTYKARQQQGGGPLRPGARDTQPPPSWLQRKMFTYNDCPHPHPSAVSGAFRCRKHSRGIPTSTQHHMGKAKKRASHGHPNPLSRVQLLFPAHTPPHPLSPQLPQLSLELSAQGAEVWRKAVCTDTEETWSPRTARPRDGRHDTLPLMSEGPASTVSDIVFCGHLTRG